MLADRLSSKVPGVAIIERGQNAETGEDIDKVIAASGAVPEEISGAGNWTMALH